MKRRKILLIVMMILTICLWAQDFPDSEPVLVKIFPVGTGTGELGFFKEMTPDGVWIGSGPSAPSTLCFNEDRLLYICDTINKRICIFDGNYNYIRSIDPSPIIEPGLLEIDDEGNLIGSFGRYGIQKMDNNSGKELIQIFLYGEKILDEVSSDGLFIIDNLVLAYKRDNGGLIGFKNPGTDYKENNRNILNTQEVMREIERNHPTIRVETGIGPSIQQKNSSSRQIVPSRQKEEYAIYENGVQLSRNFDSFMALKSQDGTVQIKSFAGESQYSALLEKYINTRTKVLLGTDNDNNTYWLFRVGIFVFNPSNVPIAAFRMEREIRTTKPVVSPSGDVYYMYSDETGHYLYKYERDW
jgi:hypothetical protein